MFWLCDLTILFTVSVILSVLVVCSDYFVLSECDTKCSGSVLDSLTWVHVYANVFVVVSVRCCFLSVLTFSMAVCPCHAQEGLSDEIQQMYFVTLRLVIFLLCTLFKFNNIMITYSFFCSITVVFVHAFKD